MHGFFVFLGKEFSEISRTWRLWVLPLIMIVIGVISPVFAELTPALLNSVAADQPGVVIQIPDPVTLDSYLQFSKNAAQMALIAVIIASAGMIAGERKSGTAILVLTKPVSRGAMVLAKAVSNWLLLLGATLLGAAVCVGLTSIMFDSSAIPEFVRSTALWFVLAALFIAITLLLSVVLKSQAGAAGAGLGVYLVLSILSLWGPARDNTFAGLVSAGDRLMLGEEAAILFPVLTAVAVACLCVAGAALVFRRQEL